MDNSNNSFQMILQQNGSPWVVALPTRSIYYDSSIADSDDFCTYEITFNSLAAVDNCHMVIGFGNSGMSGNGEFTIKDCTLEPHYSDYSLLTTDDHLIVDPAVFENDIINPPPENSNDASTSPPTVIEPALNILPVIEVSGVKKEIETEEPAEAEEIKEEVKEENIEIVQNVTDEEVTNDAEVLLPPDPPVIIEPIENASEKVSDKNKFPWWIIIIIIIVATTTTIIIKQVKKNKE